MAEDTLLQSFIKAALYRAVSMTSTITVAGLIFGQWEIAGLFGLLDAVANTGLYFAYERGWIAAMRKRRRLLRQRRRRYDLKIQPIVKRKGNSR